LPIVTGITFVGKVAAFGTAFPDPLISATPNRSSQGTQSRITRATKSFDEWDTFLSITRFETTASLHYS
jgi:hypothetical protein